MFSLIDHTVFAERLYFVLWVIMVVFLTLCSITKMVPILLVFWLTKLSDGLLTVFFILLSNIILASILRFAVELSNIYFISSYQ